MMSLIPWSSIHTFDMESYVWTDIHGIWLTKQNLYYSLCFLLNRAELNTSWTNGSHRNTKDSPQIPDHSTKEVWSYETLLFPNLTRVSVQLLCYQDYAYKNIIPWEMFRMSGGLYHLVLDKNLTYSPLKIKYSYHMCLVTRLSNIAHILELYSKKKKCVGGSFCLFCIFFVVLKYKHLSLGHIYLPSFFILTN